MCQTSSDLIALKDKTQETLTNMPTYSQSQLNIKTPEGGFEDLGWYEGRQYKGGTFGDPGVIHPMSDQQGAGQLVSPQINLQSDQAQGLNPGDIEKYLAQQRTQQLQQTGTPAGTGAGVGTGVSLGAGAGVTQGLATSAINLPDLQKTLFANSGIDVKEASLVDLEGKYLEAKGKISDNPFTSASQVDQRLQRLNRKYEEETAPIRSEIAMKKADIETEMALQMKQIDIDSQASRDALNYFNTLLDSGALNGASGESIAQITRATGIPGELLMNAVKSSASKNAKLIETTNKGTGEVTVSLVNGSTGEILNQQSLGMIGGTSSSGGSSSGSGTASKQEIVAQLAQDARDGKPLINYSGDSSGDIMSVYATYLTPAEILNVYNNNSIYEEAKESEEEINKYYYGSK